MSNKQVQPCKNHVLLCVMFVPTLVLVVSSWQSFKRAKDLSGRVVMMATKLSRSGTGRPFSSVSQCRAYRL